MITALDHIQLAHPAGAEDIMRVFYVGALAMIEVPKPEALRGRGGFWASAGQVQVHFGVDPDFVPAKKAHPAFVISDLDTLAGKLRAIGHPVRWDDKIAGVQRCFVDDPVGNRVELIAGPT